jgi:hypothetical protein
MIRFYAFVWAQLICDVLTCVLHRNRTKLCQCSNVAWYSSLFFLIVLSTRTFLCYMYILLCTWVLCSHTIIKANNKTVWSQHILNCLRKTTKNKTAMGHRHQQRVPLSPNVYARPLSPARPTLVTPMSP